MRWILTWLSSFGLCPSLVRSSPRRSSTQLSLHGFALQLELPRLRLVGSVSARNAALSPEGRGIQRYLVRHPLPHRGRGPQFELSGAAARRGLSRSGGKG